MVGSPRFVRFRGRRHDRSSFEAWQGKRKHMLTGLTVGVTASRKSRACLVRYCTVLRICRHLLSSSAICASAHTFSFLDAAGNPVCSRS